MLSPFPTFSLFLSFSSLLTLISALPIHNTLDSTPAGLTGAYSGARIDTILKRDEEVKARFGSKNGEPILPRELSSPLFQTKSGGPILPRELASPLFKKPILPREFPSPIFQAKSGEPILPREVTSSPTLKSKSGEPILPRDHLSDKRHNGENHMLTDYTAKVSQDPRTVNKNGKRDTWREAKFDPRAEVADGRGAEKGQWRNAENQFLPS